MATEINWTRLHNIREEQAWKAMLRPSLSAGTRVRTCQIRDGREHCGTVTEISGTTGNTIGVLWDGDTEPCSYVWGYEPTMELAQ